MTDAANTQKKLIEKLKTNINRYKAISKALKKHQSEHSYEEIEDMRAVISFIIDELNEPLLKGKKIKVIDGLQKKVEVYDALYNQIKIISQLFKSYDRDFNARSSNSNGKAKMHVVEIKRQLKQLLDVAASSSDESPTLVDLEKAIQEVVIFQNKYYQQEQLKVNAVIFKIGKLLNRESELDPLKKWKREVQVIFSELRKMQEIAFKNPSYINAQNIEEHAKGRIQDLIQSLKNKGDNQAAVVVEKEYFALTPIKQAKEQQRPAPVILSKIKESPPLKEQGAIKSDVRSEFDAYREQLDTAEKGFRQIYNAVYKKYALNQEQSEQNLKSFFTYMKEYIEAQKDTGTSLETIHEEVLKETTAIFPIYVKSADFPERIYKNLCRYCDASFKPMFDGAKDRLHIEESDRKRQRGPQSH